MAKWKKESGAVIETNDEAATIIAATKAGWTRQADAKKPAKKKAAAKK